MPVGEFDLAVQTMLNACYYSAEEVWSGDHSITSEASSHVLNGEVSRANELMITARAAGSVMLNRELMRGIAESQLGRLAGFYAGTYGDVRLPAYNDIESSPFDCDTPIASSKGRQYVEEAGLRQSIISEKYSGTPIVMKSVDRDVSRAYAAGLHYIHEPREDEVAAFGAYIDGETLPFAWVTYSPIAQGYKKEMMAQFGHNPDNMLEMTRAWNAGWSPKNSMSLLFAHAHTELQRMGSKGALQADGELEGVLTSINPNVGFRANAFSGVDFGVIGLKPASYKYLVGSDGASTYMLRRAIAKELGVEVRDLPEHPQFAKNAMPLIPTNEMAVMFDGKARHKPDGAIYVIDSGKYAFSQIKQ